MRRMGDGGFDIDRKLAFEGLQREGI